MTWTLDRVGCSVFLNNRYHDPTTGTFLSVDPLVATTGQAYLYANGNPMTFADPSGLSPADACLDLAAAGACKRASADHTKQIVTGLVNGVNAAANAAVEFGADEFELNKYWSYCTYNWMSCRQHANDGGPGGFDPRDPIKALSMEATRLLVALLLRQGIAHIDSAGIVRIVMPGVEQGSVPMIRWRDGTTTLSWVAPRGPSGPFAWLWEHRRGALQIVGAVTAVGCTAVAIAGTAGTAAGGCVWAGTAIAGADIAQSAQDNLTGDNVCVYAFVQSVITDVISAGGGTGIAGREAAGVSTSLGVFSTPLSNLSTTACS